MSTQPINEGVNQQGAPEGQSPRDAHPRRCVWHRPCRKNGPSACESRNTPGAACSCGRLARRRCRNFAVLGTTVCITHGAKGPHVEAAIQDRMTRMLEPALKAAHRIVKVGPKCASCGQLCGCPPEDAKVAGAQARVLEILLDRTGHGKKTTVVTEQNDNAWLQKLTDEEFAMVVELMERAETRAEKPAELHA